MHNSFILQQNVCYTTILNMFRAACCSPSGGHVVSPQPLVSSLYRQPYSMQVESGLQSALHLHTVGCLQRVTIPEAEVIQLVLLRTSSVLLETC